ncbi:MAG: hypothetical protein ACXABU_11210 [Candidatus Hodarchaeales archaeon]
MRLRLTQGLFLVIFALGMLNIVPTGVAVLGDDLYEDFESGSLIPWKATGLWHIEYNSISSYPVDNVPSGKYYAWYGDNRTGTYETFDANGTETNNSGDLISENMDLTGLSGNIVLSFQSYADTESGEFYDRKQVYVSEDDGFSWNNIGNVSAHTEWHWYAFNLTSYNNASVKIRFHFETIDEVANNMRGWLLDDIKIESGEPFIPEFFSVQIYQDNYARVFDMGWMGFEAFSNFEHNMTVRILITIVLPSGTEITLYQNSSVFLLSGEFWFYEIDYTFPEVGYYEVSFTLYDDKDKPWEATCWWEVTDGDFLLFIEQDFVAVVGKPEYLNVYVQSFLGNDTFIAVEVTIIGPLGTSLSEIIFSDGNITMNSMDSWSRLLTYTFSAPGYYDVTLIVRDNLNGIYYEAGCYYDVREDVHIHQDYYVKVGETGQMEFVVISHFAQVKDVFIEAKMQKPNGDEESFYNTSIILPAFGNWSEIVDFQFEEKGPYTVFLIVTDETGQIWSDDCWWKATDDGLPPKDTTTTIPDDTDTTSDGTDTTPTLTPGFELILLPFVLIALLSIRKRR